jgi:hypothetical protein
MISEISIIDNESAGVIAVRHCGDIFVEFNYCRNGEELQYPTKERAIEMATIIARHLFTTNSVRTEKGIDLPQMYCAIQAE